MFNHHIKMCSGGKDLIAGDWKRAIRIIRDIFGYSFMLRSRNQTTNQIPRSYKNDGFDWPFDLVIVT